MIKKFLCKYFSEDNSHERVTIESFINHLLWYNIILGVSIFIIYGHWLLFTRYPYTEFTCISCQPSIQGIHISIILVTDFLGIIIGLQILWDILKDKELVRCDK